jgi:hypothetical protein
MTKIAKVRGYQQIIAAEIAANQLRHAIHMARDAHGVAIPTDATVYIARIAGWVEKAKEGLEVDLGLAEARDQYGEVCEGK